MKKDLVSDMKVYQNAKKVSKMLGLSNSNLRKYSQILETSGYQFTKDDGKINYLEKDIIVLKRLMELVNTEGITLDDAARDIISMFDVGKHELAKPSEELPSPSTEEISKDKSTDIKPITPLKEKKSVKSAEIETIEKKLDKAIGFIMEREKIEAEYDKMIQEKDEIIAKLKAENEQHQKDKQVINLRDKLLLETIRRKQEAQRNAAGNGFWPRKNKI